MSTGSFFRNLDEKAESIKRKTESKEIENVERFYQQLFSLVRCWVPGEETLRMEYLTREDPFPSWENSSLILARQKLHDEQQISVHKGEYNKKIAVYNENWRRYESIPTRFVSYNFSRVRSKEEVISRMKEKELNEYFNKLTEYTDWYSRDFEAFGSPIVSRCWCVGSGGFEDYFPEWTENNNKYETSGALEKLRKEKGFNVIKKWSYYADGERISAIYIILIKNNCFAEMKMNKSKMSSQCLRFMEHLDFWCVESVSKLNPVVSNMKLYSTKKLADDKLKKEGYAGYATRKWGSGAKLMELFRNREDFFDFLGNNIDT